jgi:hypothetical protein
MATFTTTEPYPEKHVPALLADTWKLFQAGAKPQHTGPDGFPVFDSNPTCAEHKLLSAFIQETKDCLYTEIQPEKLATGRAILELDDAAKVRAVFAAVERVPWFWKTGVKKVKHGWFGKGWEYDDPLYRWNLQPLVTALLRQPLPLTVEQFKAIFAALHEPPDEELLSFITPKTVLRMAQARWQPGELPEPVQAGIKKILASLKRQRIESQSDGRKLLAEFDTLLGKPKPSPIERGEAWSDAALTDLKAMSGAEASAWSALVAHCATADSSKPAKKWLSEAGRLLVEVGRKSFKERVLHWFELVALPRPIHREPEHPNWQPDPDQLISERNATVLRGLVWSCAGWTDAEISTALSALAEVCFKKVRLLGPRCPRVGNACLYSLSTTSSEDAAAQLSRLDSTVKQPTAKKRIGKSLDAAATLTGQTREDLEEKSVPDFGLSVEGNLTRAFGKYSAQLQVVQSRDVEVAWSRNDGKVFKAVPADVKQDHANELKQLQKLAKDVQKMLVAQRTRIERLLMTERSWELEAWRERYLDHRLLAGITRRLIRHFKLGDRTALGIWFKGKLVDVDGRTLDWLAPETRVRLWHPIGFPVETVAAWREWLQSHEVCQPFKQAHREVYVLTDAELRTANYSNRFAAHILGQHQFAALCTQRGWKYSFMGGFDFQATPTLELPAWNMSAEFWVEPTGELATSGVARHLATDQVRFVRDGEPLPLTEVPATVFSEVMRDVDLFVGVGSIGSDPAWQDRGEVEGAGGYWHDYSFGELSATAKTRKEVLERLIPKLKIATQCSFEEKFLVVRGSLRTYKIHLGSGNIQMEPNNQYLCIVPDRASSDKHSDKFFLPFEGDRTLSVILSKAFLLADDSNIKDKSIVSQIKAR